VAYTGNKKREYQREWMAKRRKKYFPSDTCAMCGSRKDLLLHHKNPDTKVAHSIWSWAPKRMLKEIEKCVVLCRKCHSCLHFHSNPEHGTYARYKTHSCRCEKCRAANAVCSRKWRQAARDRAVHGIGSVKEKEL